MVKYAAVQPGTVVQLGRFNKERVGMSHKVGIVTEKRTVKFGNSTWSGIGVEIEPGHIEMVALHNIKEILS